MALKHTLLSKTDSCLLEQAVLAYGQIATTRHLDKIFEKAYSRASDRIRRIAFLTKAGWLVRIKKGLYLLVTDLSALASGNASSFVISNALNSDSYISFANALNWHGMFDQLTKSVDAVTSARAISPATASSSAARVGGATKTAMASGNWRLMLRAPWESISRTSVRPRPDLPRTSFQLVP